MLSSIEAFAFPAVHAVWRSKADFNDITEDDVAAAVRTELHREVQASWRDEALHRAEDPVSTFAKQFDMPKALARQYLKAPEEPGDGEKAGDGRTGGKGRKGLRGPRK